MRPFSRLLIPRWLLDEVRNQAIAESPLECCGLLAGRIENESGIVTSRFPIRNDLSSPTEYLTNPRDLLNAMKTMRTAGVEPLAIYHSHPASEPVPSRKDREQNTWGESVVHLIVGLAGLEPLVKAWWVNADGFDAAIWEELTAIDFPIP